MDVRERNLGLEDGVGKEGVSCGLKGQHEGWGPCGTGIFTFLSLVGLHEVTQVIKL